MTESLGDLMRRLAAEVPTEKLASPEDHERFMEAARVVLKLDPIVATYSGEKKSRLGLTPPDPRRRKAPDRDYIANTMTECLLRTIEDSTNPSLDPQFAYRVLAAWIVLKGLPPVQSEAALMRAENLLWRIWRDAPTTLRRQAGREGRARRTAEEKRIKSAERASIQREVADLRRRYPDENKTAIAKRLFRMHPNRWSDFNGARNWINQNVDGPKSSAHA